MYFATHIILGVGISSGSQQTLNLLEVARLTGLDEILV